VGSGRLLVTDIEVEFIRASNEWVPQPQTTFSDLFRIISLQAHLQNVDQTINFVAKSVRMDVIFSCAHGRAIFESAGVPQKFGSFSRCLPIHVVSG